MIQGERNDHLESKPLCQSFMYIYILYIFQWLTDSLRESTDQVIQVIISHTHEHLGSWLITWRQVIGVSKRVRAERKISSRVVSITERNNEERPQYVQRAAPSNCYGNSMDTIASEQAFNRLSDKAG